MMDNHNKDYYYDLGFNGSRKSAIYDAVPFESEVAQREAKRLHKLGKLHGKLARDIAKFVDLGGDINRVLKELPLA